MKPLIPFSVTTHRLFSNEDLEQELIDLGQDPNTDSQLKKLINLSQQNIQLNLLLLIMLTHSSKALFNSEYQARVARELNVIINHPAGHLLDYFLIYEDIAYFYISQNKIANIGRGSAGGSLVNFLLGITKLDPIKENLPFERFMTPTTHPDIDFDCSNKEDLINYLKNKYGNNFQQIKTKVYWKLKSALLEINRDFKYARSHEFLATVDKFTMLRTTDLRDKLKSEKDLFNFICENDLGFKEFFMLNPDKTSMLLNLLDNVKGEGKHPAAYVLSDTDNTDIDVVEQNNIVKFDFLSLTSYVKLNEKYTLSDLESIPVTEEGLLKQVSLPLKDEGLALSARVYYQTLVRKPAEPTKLLDVAAMLSKGRSSLNHILDHMKPSFRDHRVDSVLAETHGELIFQEQLMQILSNCLNIELSESVKLLKEISRQDPKFESMKKTYIAQIGDNGAEIIKFLTLLAPKLFNKSHALSYTLIDYYLSK